RIGRLVREQLVLDEPRAVHDAVDAPVAAPQAIDERSERGVVPNVDRVVADVRARLADGAERRAHLAPGEDAPAFAIDRGGRCAGIAARGEDASHGARVFGATKLDVLDFSVVRRAADELEGAAEASRHGEPDATGDPPRAARDQDDALFVELDRRGPRA